VTVWFCALERIPIKSKWPAALVRTGLDQFAFTPCILTGQSRALIWRVWWGMLMGGDRVLYGDDAFGGEGYGCCQAEMAGGELCSFIEEGGKGEC